ncbi:hypothetical protein SEA_COMRADE_177 [Streptomyces phage Comrade]|uniref:Uncharacterized protein n=3 Tax=Gilsonvirus comrade TaxID=2846395 RepID=A0A345ME83_9CAUD|nr:hypothetical protein HWB84_gp096 [Streptomyces phage Comrade]AXH68864.1 hypothetical protein SEA_SPARKLEGODDESS_180 [Streptomyces phage SparkleGoddess]QQO39838.1 hypothetical protein SEA_BELFORT_180 [Streptomyces phage Belfort]QZE11745.1 hypothetical protein SEA_KARP_174 [Streptomyces phage Karp]UTN92407.1 hypothetical protein SEA_STIGMA_178 [Streptomyces phage Stigma]AXQ63419.1 hypothetical protein SEA_COMRADE_177 [Streptomyces phage Comrade]
MAFFVVNSFYYNEETGNMFLYLTKPTEVSYEHSAEYAAEDIYEAQIFLDGGISLIGKNRPPSEDGTIPGGMYGRTANPSGTVTAPLEEAPE